MDDEYEGVTLLQPIADWLGLTIDYVSRASCAHTVCLSIARALSIEQVPRGLMAAAWLLCKVPPPSLLSPGQFPLNFGGHRHADSAAALRPTMGPRRLQYLLLHAQHSPDARPLWLVCVRPVAFDVHV